MDLASIQAAFAALKMAKDLGTAALELRDFNAAAAAISNINAQLLKAQESLFDSQGSMFSMQSENQRLQEEVRQLKAAQDLRAKYEPVSLMPGQFVYRLKESPANLQYFCQPCLDVRKHEVTLVRREHPSIRFVDYACTECKTVRHSDESHLQPAPRGIANEAAMGTDPWGRK